MLGKNSQVAAMTSLMYQLDNHFWSQLERMVTKRFTLLNASQQQGSISLHQYACYDLNTPLMEIETGWEG